MTRSPPLYFTEIDCDEIPFYLICFCGFQYFLTIVQTTLSRPGSLERRGSNFLAWPIANWYLSLLTLADTSFFS